MKLLTRPTVQFEEIEIPPFSTDPVTGRCNPSEHKVYVAGKHWWLPAEVELDSLSENILGEMTLTGLDEKWLLSGCQLIKVDPVTLVGTLVFERATLVANEKDIQS